MVSVIKKRGVYCGNTTNTVGWDGKLMLEGERYVSQVIYTLADCRPSGYFCSTQSI
jgi:hypothetical protein